MQLAFLSHYASRTVKLPYGESGINSILLAIQTQAEFDVRVASSGQVVTAIGITRNRPGRRREHAANEPSPFGRGRSLPPCRPNSDPRGPQRPGSQRIAAGTSSASAFCRKKRIRRFVGRRGKKRNSVSSLEGEIDPRSVELFPSATRKTPAKLQKFAPLLL